MVCDKAVRGGPAREQPSLLQPSIARQWEFQDVSIFKKSQKIRFFFPLKFSRFFKLFK